MDTKRRSQYAPELFSPGQVAASCLLSVVGGPVLLALNEWRFGRPIGTVGAGVSGALVLGALLAAELVFPARVLIPVLAVVAYLVTRKLHWSGNQRRHRASVFSFIGYTLAAFVVALVGLFSVLAMLRGSA